ncbi:HK97 family phage prohead protease [Actinomadura harenae]|uniref:Capsid maturation protease n=1 Tax=Actinomadura harenae TaxID=2483351 RepID=A0A3M2MDI5_9ACTN|nr:hypothetical protein [Actinomadura harenae]RMI47599.1 hypothetical protein EBO15_01475 [Actinomadura harenae]
MTITHAFAADITKAERDEHGDLIVYGKATGPDVDLDEQVCDAGWLKSAMPAWMEWGNLREMHQPVAAGVGLELEQQGDDYFVKSKVVDDSTARKIEAGALKGYSVGIKNARVVKDSTAPGGRIVGGEIVEVSYVDRPCNPTAVLALAKAAGADDALAPVEAAPDGSWREQAVALVKAVAADGSIDEQPDIAGGQEAIALIARLIKSEADELAAGELDETCDIELLLRAVECLKCFVAHEQGADDDEPADVTYVGLDAEPDTTKAADDEPRIEDVTKTTEADDVPVSKDEIQSLVKAAVAEAGKAAQERIDALAAELAKVKATPLPGGPVVTTVRHTPQAPSGTDQAAYFEHMASQVHDPVAAAGYRAKAADVRRAASINH